jgi:AraC-like DNA-binding protein
MIRFIDIMRINIDKQTFALSDPVVAYGADFDRGETIAPHTHDRAQLVFAKGGIMQVATEHGTWVVPPQRAVWLPPRIVHEILFATRGSMRTLYFEPTLCETTPSACTVVNVSPLLRELIIGSVEGKRAKQRWNHSVPLILDEISSAGTAPLHLPEPEEPRLARVTAAMKAEPASRKTLNDWAWSIGVSARTLARLFAAHTGMTFRQWQRQARLLEALVRLAENQPVATVAYDLGYESSSAFIYAFRRALGTTPKRYFQTVALGSAD